MESCQIMSNCVVDFFLLFCCLICATLWINWGRCSSDISTEQIACLARTRRLGRKEIVERQPQSSLGPRFNSLDLDFFGPGTMCWTLLDGMQCQTAHTLQKAHLAPPLFARRCCCSMAHNGHEWPPVLNLFIAA